MNITLVPANEYRRERWKNGHGWTREIVRWPEDGPSWDWRLSIAEVDKDCEFSSFPEMDRELVLLTGEGMRLVFADGESRELLPPHERIRFAGEREVRVELLSGPTQDFNLMWRRERIDATVLHRPLVGPMVFFAERDVSWAVYVIGGRAHFKDQLFPMVLEQGDTALILPHPAGANRVILEGGAELLLFRIERLQPN